MTASARAAGAADMLSASGLVSLSTSSGKQVATQVGIDSKRSRFARMSRSIMKGALLHAAHCFQPIMLTTTYRADAKPSPKDISQALHAARDWARYRRIPLRYVWAAEMTKKGKLHYHVLFFLPAGVKLPMFDSKG